MATDELPRHAAVVIVGGGVMGVSAAYHLARGGQTDVLLLERADLLGPVSYTHLTLPTIYSV